MKFNTNMVRQIVIDDMVSLDPVRVITENYESGKGRITITCYGRAWTGAWFAMGGVTIEKFFVDAHASYLIDNLTNGMARTLKCDQKHDEAYLKRIINVVQQAFRHEMENAT